MSFGVWSGRTNLRKIFCILGIGKGMVSLLYVFGGESSDFPAEKRPWNNQDTALEKEASFKDMHF